VLDVGHTVDAGCISARNVPEYDFNLRLAKYLERSLIEDGFTKTVLLVTGAAQDQACSPALPRQRLSANLLVSIHHDRAGLVNGKLEFEGKEAISATDLGVTRFSSRTRIPYRQKLAVGRLLGNELRDRGLQYAVNTRNPSWVDTSAN